MLGRPSPVILKANPSHSDLFLASTSDWVVEAMILLLPTYCNVHSEIAFFIWLSFTWPFCVIVFSPSSGLLTVTAPLPCCPSRWSESGPQMWMYAASFIRADSAEIQAVRGKLRGTRKRTSSVLYKPFKSTVVTIYTAWFKTQQFYVLPTQCIYVFCVDLRTNSDYFPIQH